MAVEPARHHSDTIIVGRDPEIAVPRPPSWSALALRFFGINTTFTFFRSVLLHCTGRLTAAEKTFIPESEYGKLVLRAYIYLAVYAAVIGLAVGTGSVLPLMYVGLPAFYGSWLQFIYGHTQHTCLADGLVTGNIIECAKHNGRFDLTDGSPKRPPACLPLKTYQAGEHDGKIFLKLDCGDRG